MSIETIVDNIIAAEGGYTCNKSDLGGATCWGITEVVARANGYYGDMKDLPKDFARQVYKNKYWFDPKFDQIEVLSPRIAEELCDTGVNCGINFAKPLIQDCLNLLNRQEVDYKDIKVDGAIGPGTLAALAAFIIKRGKAGEDVILKMLNIMQGNRYIEITRTRPVNEDFLFGWIANRVTLKE